MKKSKGFTLIELLVVIAIIGILSAIILAAVNNSRKNARDAQRISDIKQIQNALELYYLNNNFAYPVDIYTGAPLAPYINLQIDPKGGNYRYTGLSIGSTTGTPCTGYHLATSLENKIGPLGSDTDFYSMNAAPGNLSAVQRCGNLNNPYAISGDDNAKCSTFIYNDYGNYCYDIKK